MKDLKHCSFCGGKLVFKSLFDGTKEKYCFECDYVFFNSPSPSVIVAVINGDKILLTRGVGWNHSFWGLIGGHLKPDETAEEAAIREVKEEVGLNIFDLKIQRSYAIKDYNVLIIGFTAKTKGVNFTISQELEKASWFDLYKPLPIRPSSVTSQIVEKIQASYRI